MEQESPPHHALRHLELRLLRCTLSPDLSIPPSPPPTTPTLQLLTDLVQLIESGRYLEALSSSGVFEFKSSTHFDDSIESAQSFYSDFLPVWVDSHRALEGDELEQFCRVFLLFVVAVAALLAFTQCNVTGPMVELPALPAIALASADIEGSACNRWFLWETWAQKEVMAAGSDLVGKFSNLQYLVFAKVLLIGIKDLLLDEKISTFGLRSTSWWFARLLLVQQRLLDDLASSLFDLLQANMQVSLFQYGTIENVANYWGSKLSEEDGLTIVSVLHLEAGLVDLTYGRVDSAGNHFEKAQFALRLDFSISAAMGFRTVHQVEPRAQLLLVTGNSYGDNVDSVDKDVSLLRHPPETFEASDVLMAPKFSEDHSSSESDSRHVAPTHLKPVQQAVVLAKCLAIEKGTGNDDYQQYKMGPYIEAIDHQKSSYFMIQYFSDILRVRWESTRSHTKQRAVMMMDKLVQVLNELLPGVSERMFCCFALSSPTFPALRKEHGDLLVSCGLIGEAIKVYEDLELWDNLIYCYRLLEKKAAAVDLIKMQLSIRPQDPRLWCSLADVTYDDSYYEKALEVSGNNSARALRSLARSAYNKGEYEKSKALWDSAMRLNSLYRDGWFALGAAALKAKDFDMALDGFTRAVQIDPEHGEAWNNIACLHMIRKKSKEAFVACKEALKLNRNSWKMWENFSHVAADVGNYSQAMEAVCNVLDLTNNKRFDVDLLERLVQEIENLSSNMSSKYSLEINNGDCSRRAHKVAEVNNITETASSEDGAKKREAGKLIELLGKIFRQIVQSNSGAADIWGLYARWHRLKGDLSMCSEALLKQVRAYQGSDLWRDNERFIKFAHASLELCNVYQEIACRTGSRRELFASEMHLKGILKQGVNFADSQEYKSLSACLNEVQKKLENYSPAAV